MYTQPYAQPFAKQDRVLKTYISPAGVNYAQLQNNHELQAALLELEQQPDQSNSKAQLAYWLNVYNLFTLKLIAENYPVDSITDMHLLGSVILGYLFDRTVWQTWHFKLGGRDYSLDQVEHQIIRPRFNDFRAHAAMVCAAVSCPPLREEAYRAERLDDQLDDQMRIWLADETKNRFDAESNTLYLSSIFKWFDDDFTEHGKKDLITVLLPYFPEDTRAQIKAHRTRIKISYLSYDWDLNDHNPAAD